jgi:ABC-type multidrug transport system permease subunit
VTPGKRLATWFSVAVAIAALAAVVVVVGGFWTGLGDVGLSAGGWFAMGLGVVATLALGIGLMALVFISSRRGYDEPGERR